MWNYNKFNKSKLFDWHKWLKYLSNLKFYLIKNPNIFD